MDRLRRAAILLVLVLVIAIVQTFQLEKLAAQTGTTLKQIRSDRSFGLARLIGKATNYQVDMLTEASTLSHAANHAHQPWQSDSGGQGTRTTIEEETSTAATLRQIPDGQPEEPLAQTPSASSATDTDTTHAEGGTPKSPRLGRSRRSSSERSSSSRGGSGSVVRSTAKQNSTPAKRARRNSPKTSGSSGSVSSSSSSEGSRKRSRKPDWRAERQAQAKAQELAARMASLESEQTFFKKQHQAWPHSPRQRSAAELRDAYPFQFVRTEKVSLVIVDSYIIDSGKRVAFNILNPLWLVASSINCVYKLPKGFMPVELPKSPHTKGHSGRRGSESDKALAADRSRRPAVAKYLSENHEGSSKVTIVVCDLPSLWWAESVRLEVEIQQNAAMAKVWEEMLQEVESSGGRVSMYRDKELAVAKASKLKTLSKARIVSPPIQLRLPMPMAKLRLPWAPPPVYKDTLKRLIEQTKRLPSEVREAQSWQAPQTDLKGSALKKLAALAPRPRTEYKSNNSGILDSYTNASAALTAKAIAFGAAVERRLKPVVYCSAPLHAGMSFNIGFLAEWFGVMLALGVDHFMFYPTGRDWREYPAGLQDLLEGMQQLGIVTVLDWFSSDHKYHDYAFYKGQKVVMEDCLFRTKNAARFVMFHDVDEIMWPMRASETSLLDILDDYSGPEHARLFGIVTHSYLFDSQTLLPEVEGRADMPVLSRLRWRQKQIAQTNSRSDSFRGRCKYMVNPENGVELNVHMVAYTAKHAYVPDNRLLLHHWRGIHGQKVMFGKLQRAKDVKDSVGNLQVILDRASAFIAKLPPLRRHIQTQK